MTVNNWYFYKRIYKEEHSYDAKTKSLGQLAAVFAYGGLCGGEIYLGQLYYEMDDRLLCPECLPEYAKSYFLSRQRTAMLPEWMA